MNSTTIELEGAGMAFRFARTTEPRPLSRAALGGGLPRVMPPAQRLEVLVGVIVTAPYVVDLIGWLAALAA